MCAKVHQVLSRLIPDGAVKDACTSAYYSLYYNRKHYRENGFRVYYRNGHFAYRFDEGVEFASYENMADELKRSLKGYLANYTIKPGDVVVDGGAYIGEFTLYAAKAVGPTGKVIAFEPDPAIDKAFRANLDLNNIMNVTVINKGLWSKDGVLKFVGDSIKGYSFMFAPDTAGAVDLPVVSLDNELERLGIRRVNFIKADIEGAEIEFLKGAERTLEANDAGIAVASYHAVDGKKTCFAVEKALMLLGFKAYTGHARHLTTYGSKS